ncbi:MAG TPA: GAF domain-containing protein [Polyangiaceae bacterium]|nr:GAF domain-containing protein [Polyangiaceae bacterium]
MIAPLPVSRSPSRSVSLSDLQRCFAGVLPSIITTCSANGVPNVTYLSQIFRVDERIALSCQFFNKTKQNLAENPFASVQVIDPLTLEMYDLDLRFEHSQTEGPLFEKMATRIQAIASHTGMLGVFKLVSADVFEVLAIREVEGLIGPPLAEPDADSDEAPMSLRTELRALSVVTERLRRATDLDGLLSTLLDALRDELGFEHAMLLLPDETGKRLVSLASRGYGESGIGAEVSLGDGLIGTVAETKQTIRISNVSASLSYGRAVGRTAQDHGAHVPGAEIPLPGLPDAQSQLAIPLSSNGRLSGVLAVESKNPLGFEEWHETFLDVIGHQLASAIENMMLRAEAEEAQTTIARTAPPVAAAPAPRVLRLCFYRNDDCVFVDDEYLIRNLPGRILWKILRSYVDGARAEFSNRELRLDPSLGLPPIKDNLESRLILLRKRLEQKCPELRLVPKSRGQFRLETSCTLSLTEKD